MTGSAGACACVPRAYQGHSRGGHTSHTPGRTRGVPYQGRTWAGEHSDGNLMAHEAVEALGRARKVARARLLESVQEPCPVRQQHGIREVAGLVCVQCPHVAHVVKSPPFWGVCEVECVADKGSYVLVWLDDPSVAATDIDDCSPAGKTRESIRRTNEKMLERGADV